jgi:predicted nucleic acid-binding protein
MNNLFIDTDVIIDLITNREPFSMEAAILFTLAEQKKIKIFASSLTFSNLYYILRKFESHIKVISKLNSLSGLLSILKVDEPIVRNAIQSGFNDFEDGLQYFCALEYKHIDVIITRNTKDFKNSEIPVMIPGDFLKTMQLNESRNI